MSTEIFYHGSCALFEEFSLDFLGSGDGKAKYGHGIYVTSSLKTADNYARKIAQKVGKNQYYIYTVEIPTLTEENHIYSRKPVHPSIVERVEQAIGEAVPEEVTQIGKHFRKYVGNLLSGRRSTIKKMTSKADDAAESAVATLFDQIGLAFLVWPQAQTKPDGDTNRAVLNTKNISVVKVEAYDND